MYNKGRVVAYYLFDMSTFQYGHIGPALEAIFWSESSQLKSKIGNIFTISPIFNY
jgi:hypothetical protein